MMHVAMAADGSTITLTAKDHAGFAPEGDDIVCSAASILANMACKYAEILYGSGKLAEDPVIHMEPGDAEITIKPLPDHYHIAVYTFSIFGIGFDMLAKEFPEYVSYKPFGKEL